MQTYQTDWSDVRYRQRRCQTLAEMQAHHGQGKIAHGKETRGPSTHCGIASRRANFVEEEQEDMEDNNQLL